MEFYEFTSAWLLGIITIHMTNDSVAIAQCRLYLLDLEKELEDLRKDPSGQCASDIARRIRQIKNILKLFNVHYAGLFIKRPELKELIDKSLERIRQWEQEPHEPQNAVGSVGVDIRSCWGYIDRYESTKLKDIQHFLHAGFLKRPWLRLKEMISSVIKL